MRKQDPDVRSRFVRRSGWRLMVEPQPRLMVSARPSVPADPVQDFPAPPPETLAPGLRSWPALKAAFVALYGRSTPIISTEPMR